MPSKDKSSHCLFLFLTEQSTLMASMLHAESMIGQGKEESKDKIYTPTTQLGGRGELLDKGHHLMNNKSTFQLISKVQITHALVLIIAETAKLNISMNDL